MLTCLIIDDEPLAISLLKNYVLQLSELELVAATTDVYKALEVATQKKIDILFLDIQMPELTGIQVMKLLNGKMKVILTTAYDQYAVQAFEHDVVDYLLKPFSFERFVAAIAKAKERLRPGQPQPPPDYIFVKSGYKMVKVKLADILYLEALRDYIAIHTVGEKILTLQSLRSFEEQLPAAQFKRIHKSYIISIAKITSMERKKIFIQQHAIPVGETYIDRLKDLPG